LSAAAASLFRAACQASQQRECSQAWQATQRIAFVISGDPLKAGVGEVGNRRGQKTPRIFTMDFAARFFATRFFRMPCGRGGKSEGAKITPRILTMDFAAHVSHAIFQNDFSVPGFSPAVFR
jgi:hypothetical protein